ncbi:hypothetical protein Tco_1375165 [Tanacetum coccineum]
MSIRNDLKLDDAKGTNCLPTATIFEELERMGFVQVYLNNQFEGMSKHKGIYVIPSHTKKVFANMKRPGKGFSRRVTSLFSTMMVQALEDMGKDLAAPTDSYYTPIITQPSSSKPQKKKSIRKQRKDSGPTEPVTDEAHEKVLDLEKATTSQAKEIASLKKIVKQLEKRRHSRTLRLKRLRKVRSASSVESLNDVSLGAPKDTSKQGRKIADLDANAEVTLINETQEINDDDLMFDIDILDDDKVFEEPMAFAATTTRLIPVTTTTSVEIPDELTLAQTLIEIKITKTKAVTTDATTVTHVFTRPKAKGTVFDDQDEQAPTNKQRQR